MLQCCILLLHSSAHHEPITKMSTMKFDRHMLAVNTIFNYVIASSALTHTHQHKKYEYLHACPGLTC